MDCFSCRRAVHRSFLRKVLDLPRSLAADPAGADAGGNGAMVARRPDHLFPFRSRQPSMSLGSSVGRFRHCDCHALSSAPLPPLWILRCCARPSVPRAARIHRECLDRQTEAIMSVDHALSPIGAWAGALRRLTCPDSTPRAAHLRNPPITFPAASCDSHSCEAWRCWLLLGAYAFGGIDGQNPACCCPRGCTRDRNQQPRGSYAHW